MTVVSPSLHSQRVSELAVQLLGSMQKADMYWLACFGQAGPTYGSAHVFFTSKVAPQHLAALRSCPGLLSRLKALAEVWQSCFYLLGIP